MQAVVATVNEQWESPLADEIVQRWEHDPGRARYWRASANFVFFFKRAGQEYVLRFNHASERTSEAIQAEIEFVNALASKGIRVAKPVRSHSGRYVESVNTDHGVFHAVVFEALKGEQIEEIDDLTQEQFIHWGKALGELHNASAAISVAGRPTWQAHLNMVAATLPPTEQAARQTLENLQNQLSQLAVNDHNFGLIHYDFELDNIIWEGQQAGIIDFDDSAMYWFVADIVLALGDLLGERADLVDVQNESYVNFLEGYRSVRLIADDELKLIPLFMRMDNLVTFAKLHRALTPVNPAGELPWMAGLRDKLTAKMDLYRDEFSKYSA